MKKAEKLIIENSPKLAVNSNKKRYYLVSQETEYIRKGDRNFVHIMELKWICLPWPGGARSSAIIPGNRRLWNI
jgi:hypothetical protein